MGQAVKVLRTAEFVPYVVFIEAPDFETLKAMNKAALENGVATKQLTVSAPLGRLHWGWGNKRRRPAFRPLHSWVIGLVLDVHYLFLALEWKVSISSDTRGGEGRF